jgi:hypothetical protein
MAAHACDRMREELEKRCDEHSDRFACPDALVTYEPKFDEYGIIVHDGGHSSVQIAFCPWCGVRLPDSKRDRWFDELEARGIDPSNPEVPSEFRTEEWWSRRTTE